MPALSDKIVVVAFFAVAALPRAATLAHVHDHGVHGALARPDHPKLTFDGIRDESYQSSYKAWFEAALRLKGYAINIDNTLLFHVLHDAKPGGPVSIGSDNMLFSGEDISYYNRDTLPFDPVKLDRFATRLAAVQSKLGVERRGFIPVIVPSKTSIYRDLVSARWTRDLGEPRPSDTMFYATMKRALDAHHVTYVDARELLTTSSAPRELLWGRVARHWSSYGACLVLQQVARRFTELTGRALDYDCHVSFGAVPAGHDDFDLMQLLNAYGVPYEQRVPVVSHELPAARDPLSVMFVGTSFCRRWYFDAQASLQFSRVAMDYYNATLVTAPWDVEGPIQPHTPAWRDAFLGNDLYVLDLLETYYAVADVFIDQFLDELTSELR